MSKIAEALDRAKTENRTALVAYVCAGDPNLETTSLVLAKLAEYADVIELGVPFSDPTADGPSIQRASERALAAGTTLQSVLDTVRVFRRTHQTPVVLFGYYNPILAFGEERFAREAASAGANGALVVDLPPEEGQTFIGHLHSHQLDYIPLIAPTSTASRVANAATLATGFLYYVSVTGVTGAAVDLRAAAQAAHTVQIETKCRVAIGFGIKTPEDAKSASSAGVSAVVVGSAFINEIEAATSPTEAAERVANLARSLRVSLGSTSG